MLAFLKVLQPKTVEEAYEMAVKIRRHRCLLVGVGYDWVAVHGLQ